MLRFDISTFSYGAGRPVPVKPQHRIQFPAPAAGPKPIGRVVPRDVEKRHGRCLFFQHKRGLTAEEPVAIFIKTDRSVLENTCLRQVAGCAFPGSGSAKAMRTTVILFALQLMRNRIEG